MSLTSYTDFNGCVMLDPLCVILLFKYTAKSPTKYINTYTFIASRLGVCSRGLLDYKKPVKDYWPEFAQNGKEEITVETLLSHQVNRPPWSHSRTPLIYVNLPAGSTPKNQQATTVTRKIPYDSAELLDNM